MHTHHEPTGPLPDGDVVAFGTPRRQLHGSGCALRIDVPAPWCDNLSVVDRALAGLPGAVALGALPFDRAAPGTFVVPAVLHTRTADGDQWTTVVGPTPPDGDDAGDRPTPSELTVRSVRPTGEWLAAVEAARTRIVAGDLTKVVLARELEVVGDVAFDPVVVWERLRRAHPTALTFCIDGFVGASPELLVSRLGATVRAQPMAGTTPRSGDPAEDQRLAGDLLASAKNRDEHRITIDAVHDALLGWCSYLDAEPRPSVVAAGAVQHLATMVEGRLSAPEPSVTELVAALHPTPAVGGHPRGAALALQDALEGFDRGRYAGPVGWVDSDGNGAFAVGIRSVQLEGNRARLAAGVGVVADSDPRAELEETRAKAQAVIGALVRP